MSTYHYGHIIIWTCTVYNYVVRLTKYYSRADLALRRIGHYTEVHRLARALLKHNRSALVDDQSFHLWVKEGNSLVYAHLHSLVSMLLLVINVTHWKCDVYIEKLGGAWGYILVFKVQIKFIFSMQLHQLFRSVCLWDDRQYLVWPAMIVVCS